MTRENAEPQSYLAPPHHTLINGITIRTRCRWDEPRHITRATSSGIHGVAAVQQDDARGDGDDVVELLGIEHEHGVLVEAEAGDAADLDALLVQGLVEDADAAARHVPEVRDAVLDEGLVLLGVVAAAGEGAAVVLAHGIQLDRVPRVAAAGGEAHGRAVEGHEGHVEVADLVPLVVRHRLDGAHHVAAARDGVGGRAAAFGELVGLLARLVQERMAEVVPGLAETPGQVVDVGIRLEVDRALEVEHLRRL